MIEKYTKNISNQSNISKLRTNDFLQEIKKNPQKRELNKLKKWIKSNE